MQRTYQLSDIPATRAEGALAARLCREGVRRRFPAGALIQQQGDRDAGLWLVESGTVSLCRFAPDGAVTVYGVLGAGDLFGELAHFAQVPRQVDAVADGDAVLVRIGPALVDRLCAMSRPSPRGSSSRSPTSCAPRSTGSTAHSASRRGRASPVRWSTWPAATDRPSR